MANSTRQPILMVFAGPNGSGKSTITQSLPKHGTYVNADDIKAENGLSDLNAAQKAEALREKLLYRREDFSFETVLSTERNLFLMNRAKKAGYRVNCVYVLTNNPTINVARVKDRVANGGHDVPEEKIKSRYYRALSLVPQVNQLCDVLLIYDNSTSPVLIYQKDETSHRIFPSSLWPEERIKKLLGL